MSSVFTTPTATNWDTCLLELANAYSERRQALGLSAYTASWRDVQSATFWRIHQDFLETYCTSFVNPNITITDQSTVPMYTLATWRSEAGLNALGFKRYNVNGVLNYGQLQQNDTHALMIQIGELQAGYSALTWTTGSPSTTVNDHKSSNARDSDCSTAYSDAETDWNSSSWSTPTPKMFVYDYLYLVGAWGIEEVSGDTYIGDERCKGSQCIISSIPTFRSHAIDLYFLSEKVSEYNLGSDHYFKDFDSLGATEDKLFLFQSTGYSTNSSFTSNSTGTTTWPTGLVTELACPYPSGNFEAYSIGVKTARYVLKWDFTYSN